MLGNRRLLAAMAAGAGLFFTFVGTFSYVTFRLEARAVRALPGGRRARLPASGRSGWPGPLAGPGGGAASAGSTLALACMGLMAAGLLLSLPEALVPAIAGAGLVTLANFAGVTAAQLGVAGATAQDRGLATALYFTAYYVAGGLGGYLPGLAYEAWDWPGRGRGSGSPCVAAGALAVAASRPIELTASAVIPASQGVAASAQTARTSASTAASASAASTDSAGAWLTPPAQRTKSIPTGIAAASATASWPAPLGRSGAPAAASASAATSRGSIATAGASMRGSHSTRDVARGADRRRPLEQRGGRGGADGVVGMADVQRRRRLPRRSRSARRASAVSRPTVATRPGSARPASSTASTNSASAHAASRRARHRHGAGVAGLAGEDDLGARVWPAIAVTTPSGAPARSSTGPCSMWTSR